LSQYSTAVLLSGLRLSQYSTAVSSARFASKMSMIGEQVRGWTYPFNHRPRCWKCDHSHCSGNAEQESVLDHDGWKVLSTTSITPKRVCGLSRCCWRV
jgi:hypothetical protein